MATTEMNPERIGVARNKNLNAPALFHRGTVKLSTKFRVWLVPGDDRFIELDPSEFREKYEVLQQFKPEGAASRPT